MTSSTAALAAAGVEALPPWVCYDPAHAGGNSSSTSSISSEGSVANSSATDSSSGSGGGSGGNTTEAAFAAGAALPLLTVATNAVQLTDELSQLDSSALRALDAAAAAAAAGGSTGSWGPRDLPPAVVVVPAGPVPLALAQPITMRRLTVLTGPLVGSTTAGSGSGLPAQCAGGLGPEVAQRLGAADWNLDAGDPTCTVLDLGSARGVLRLQASSSNAGGSTGGAAPPPVLYLTRLTLRGLATRRFTELSEAGAVGALPQAVLPTSGTALALWAVEDGEGGWVGADERVGWAGERWAGLGVQGGGPWLTALGKAGCPSPAPCLALPAV